VGDADAVAHETQNLVERIRRRESSAQEEFVNLYRRPIQAIATVRTGDPEAAQDICQDVLIAVLMAIERNQIREPDKLSAYVHGVARNLINKFLCLRASRRETDIDLIEIPGANFLDEVGAKERKRLVVSVLRGFSALDQQILLLSWVDGHTLKDVARKLGISHATARKHKSRMVSKLKNVFGQLSQERSQKAHIG
jgi:RNA polymerase sigma factor (sigma-70 family)